VGYCFGRDARRDGQIGGGYAITTGDDDRQRKRETCNDAIWPHAAFLNAMTHVRCRPAGVMPAEQKI
jgi:hypothetical protein